MRRTLSLELDAKGGAVTGNLEGRAFRESRLEGSTLTLKLSGPNNEDVSLIGQVSGDEILFKSTGLPAGPDPVRRPARPRSTSVAGSVSDPAAVEQLMKQFNVPGVSIAVIKDFKVVFAVRLRRRRRRDGRAGDHRDDVPGGVDQQAGGGDGVAEGGAGRPLRASIRTSTRF